MRDKDKRRKCFYTHKNRVFVCLSDFNECFCDAPPAYFFSPSLGSQRNLRNKKESCFLQEVFNKSLLMSYNLLSCFSSVIGYSNFIQKPLFCV